jgi:type IV secretory pathway VirJ component
MKKLHRQFFISVLACLLAVLLPLLTTGIWYATQQPLIFSTITFGDMGDTQVLDGGHRGLIIVLYSKAEKFGAEHIAQAIAHSGRVAALIDVDDYFAKVHNEHPACFNMITLLDVYAQHIQQQLTFEHFNKPALIGMGSADKYLQLILAQAPAGIFAAGISINSDETLRLPVAPCGEWANKVQWQSPSQPVTVPADMDTASPWANFPSGHWPAVLQAMLASPTVTSNINDVSDLPLVELPLAHGGKAPFIALVMSGDGGWANIDKDIAEALGKNGIAVVGWNSLRYFWKPKTPEVMTADLARVLKHYRKAWGKQQVLLIGFSAGADVMPFMVTRLPADLRQSLTGMVLLSPSLTVDFQFHISDWLNTSPQNTHALLPEINAITQLPILCVYGSHDEDGACPLIRTHNQTRLQQLPGDHHFDGDYATVTKLIIEQFLMH